MMVAVSLEFAAFPFRSLQRVKLPVYIRRKSSWNITTSRMTTTAKKPWKNGEVRCNSSCKTTT